MHRVMLLYLGCQVANLFPTPQNFDLPLSLGQDLSIDFQRQDDAGNPLDYDIGTTVTLIIDAAEPINGVAIVNGHHANVLVLSEVVDLVKKATLWRCRITLPDNTDIVPCNGQIIRYDGKNR